MNKKITSSALAALMIAGSTSFSALASMSNGTVVIGNKAFDLAYANDPSNAEEITSAIVAGGAVYVKDFEGNWIDNTTGLSVNASLIPAVVYKNATGETNFNAGDKDAASTLEVKSVSAVTANSLKVTFSAAVDTTKAVLSVKMGTVPANIKSVTWNDAKTEATLTGYGSFSAGDYTVTASGISNLDTTKNFGYVTFAAQKVSSIAFTGTKAVLTSATTATTGYVIKDQYGTDVTSTFEGTLSVSATGTTGTPTHTGGVMTMTFATAPIIDTTVVATLVDSATGVVGTATLKVASASAADSITLSELKNVDSKVLRTNTVLGTDLFQYDVNAVDQYGTAVNTATALTNDFIVLYSNPSLTSTFVSSTSTSSAKLKITGVPSVAGTYTITLVSKTSGKSLVVPVVVADTISVSTFTMQTPATTLKKGETTNIPFTAVDQYGNALTQYSDLNGKMTFTIAGTDTTNPATYSMVSNPIDGTAQLKITVPAANTASSIIVTSIVNGKTSTSQLNLALNAVAVPTTIQSLSSDVAKKLVIDATSTIEDKDFVINDQYGRVMDLPAGYTIGLVSSTPAKITVGASIAPAGSVVLTGVAAGSSVVTATLLNAGTPIANSGIDFTATTVAKADITSYGIDTAAKVYTAGTYSAGEKAAYAASYTVYGMTSAGDKVALDQSTSGADIVTVSSTNVNLDSVRLAAGEVYATGVTKANTDETATIVAVVNGANGIVTVTKTITLTDKAPVGSAIEVKATSGNYVSFASGVAVMTATQVNAMNTKIVSSHAQYSANLAPVYFEVLDQYGVASTSVKPAYYTLKSTNAAGTGNATGTYSIASSTGVISAASAATGDIITITAVTTDGKVSTAKIIVQ